MRTCCDSADAPWCLGCRHYQHVRQAVARDAEHGACYWSKNTPLGSRARGRQLAGCYNGTRPTVIATRQHVLYVSERGALDIVYDYATSFARLFDEPDVGDDEMQKRLGTEVASQCTVLLGGWPGLVSIEACGDRVACSAHRDKVVTFDAAHTSVPDVPCPTTRSSSTPRTRLPSTATG